MERYDSYKDSGVEWIGEIPVIWEKTKLKYYLSEVLTGGTPNTSEENYWSSQKDGINWISISDMTSNGREINYTRKRITKEGLNSKNLFVLPIGTLIYSIYGSIGKVSRLGIPSTIHQGILGFTTNNKLDSVFLEYFLFYLKEYVSLFSSSNTQENLNQEKVLNFEISIPPINEQQQIVFFLDTKTSLIDSLIEKTQKKMELLKEQRTTLINEVVTKGLNPHVEFKDSGVEWIGKIPSHWENRKGSTIGNYSKGKGIKKDEVKESGHPCIRYGEIYTKYNHTINEVYSFIDDETIETSIRIQEKSLLLTGSGETFKEIGKCVVYIGSSPIWIGGDIIILKPKEDIESEFLTYLINSECVRIQREVSGRGEIIVHIYSKNFRDMRFPIPPLSEQTEIVEFLDRKTNLIDSTISIEEKRIEHLQEYRQSLISEVVTGKIKVTD